MMGKGPGHKKWNQHGAKFIKNIHYCKSIQALLSRSYVCEEPRFIFDVSSLSSKLYSTSHCIKLQTSPSPSQLSGKARANLGHVGD
jgi:hypothetical protein